jgi:hypothetical protein
MFKIVAVVFIGILTGIGFVDPGQACGAALVGDAQWNTAGS